MPAPATPAIPHHFPCYRPPRPSAIRASNCREAYIRRAAFNQSTHAMWPPTRKGNRMTGNVTSEARGGQRRIRVGRSIMRASALARARATGRESGKNRRHPHVRGTRPLVRFSVLARLMSLCTRSTRATGTRTTGLKVPDSWVYEKTRGRCRNPIPCLRLGRYVRFDWVAVATWLTAPAPQDTNPPRPNLPYRRKAPRLVSPRPA
jgi:hypothetical protein